MSTPPRVPVSFTVNGERREIRVEPRRSLADALREDCGLTGTHVGCEHGVCGACTVLLDGRPVRSCLLFAVQAGGHAVRTVEGLAPRPAPGAGGAAGAGGSAGAGHEPALHPLQQAFWEHHGLQCGFCTPGFLMLAVGVLEAEPDIDEESLRHVLSSNLCRCTGYQNIFTAVRAAAARMKTQR